MRSMQVLALVGSLRKDSYNRKLFEAARELAPRGMRLEAFDLGLLPLYNADLHDTAQFPEPVERLHRAIRAADAVLLLSPEYNHSVSGVLKNAIDWASRGPSAPLQGKPAAIAGASTGMIGTARAQMHLREICAALEMPLVPSPEVLVANAKQKFDASGHLTDENSRKFLKELLEGLAELVQERSSVKR